MKRYTILNFFAVACASSGSARALDRSLHVAPDGVEATIQADPSKTPTTLALHVAGSSSDDLCNVAMALMRAGEFDQATKVAKKIKYHRFSNAQKATFNRIALAFVDDGQTEKAAEVALMNETPSLSPGIPLPVSWNCSSHAACAFYQASMPKPFC